MTHGFPRPLAITGFLHLALLAVLMALAPFETRQVMGINLWIKPIKFASSIAIYCFTLGWYLRYLAGPPRAIRVISWGVSMAMVTEMIAIIGQAARGTTSISTCILPSTERSFR